MAEGELLTGQEAREILRDLRKNSTILQMHLKGTHFKKLTVVTAIQPKPGRPLLYVDHPPGFAKAAEGVDNWEIVFTFTGVHGIPYSFTTFGGFFREEDNTIAVEAPEAVERKQRRKHLRVKPPVGTVTTAIIDGEGYDIQIVNISLGGALVMFSSPVIKEDVVKRGQEVKDITIDLFPGKAGKEPVKVDRAVIRRVITEHVTSKQHYGLMFIDMARNETMRLKDYIYVNQRLMLRKTLISS
ncbi:MAG: PilZ domain-containing protein [Thermodesulfobacteriota bacterium]|nr:PilZ domain-containing protein [Thermodesulfobacteriota bacterium]